MVKVINVSPAEYAASMDALNEGPPALTATRITADMADLTGKRVVAYDENGNWVRDLRAADRPWMHDETTFQRWYPDEPVPEGANELRARLFVSVMREDAWYEWQRTKRRGKVHDAPAYLVFRE